MADGTSAADETVKSHCKDCYQSAPSHPTPDMHGPDADPKHDFNFYTPTDTSQFKYIFQLYQANSEETIFLTLHTTD